jgi:hypothetical protein
MLSCAIGYGCRRSSETFVNRPYTFEDVNNYIHVGSPKEDVIFRFGKPNNEWKHADGNVVWVYSIYPDLRKKGAGFGGFTVGLKDGKVVRLDPILSDD